jgi:basic membrane lipoprotein Med (substrate-binding protein (PBP1-ABC) superfamily)
MAPEVVLASATLDIPAAFVAVARRVRDGSFTPAPLRMGLADGIVAVEMNPRLADRVPPALREELAALEARIRAGELVVPRGEF